MKRTDLSFQEIFNSLLAGQKLVLHFPHKSAAETFRTRLHHQKTAQETSFAKLGMTNDEEKTVLQFRMSKPQGAEGEELVAYVQFALPSPLKKYPVLIIEEDDLKKKDTGNAEISTSVG